MKQKLSARQTLYASFMLFSIFFGAGNMIFPPRMGQMAGDQTFWALIGFAITDAGLAMLGVWAVVRSGLSMEDLTGKVGRRVGKFLTVFIYLLLGPLFAIPRTGAVSFELAVLPFVPEGASAILPSVLYTAVFFTLTAILALNPSRVVSVIGKLLTPFLLLSIFSIFIAALVNPVGPITAPVPDYEGVAFFRGLIEGYLTLDGFAGLVFVVTLTNAFRDMGVTDHRSVMRSSVVVGVLASVLLIVVYGALAFIGAQTSSLPLFLNGGILLTTVVNQLFGKAGILILGTAVGLACLTTSIGLTASFADYFCKLSPRFSRKAISIGVCLFSFMVSNVGLDRLVSIVLPILVTLYPMITVVVLLSYFDRALTGRPEVYWLTMTSVLLYSLADALVGAGAAPAFLASLVELVPFSSLGIGWVLPAVFGLVLSLTPFGVWFRHSLIEKGL